MIERDNNKYNTTATYIEGKKENQRQKQEREKDFHILITVCAVVCLFFFKDKRRLYSVGKIEYRIPFFHLFFLLCRETRQSGEKEKIIFFLKTKQQQKNNARSLSLSTPTLSLCQSKTPQSPNRFIVFVSFSLSPHVLGAPSPSLRTSSAADAEVAPTPPAPPTTPPPPDDSAEP